MCGFPVDLNAEVSVPLNLDCTVQKGQTVSFRSSLVNLLRWAENASNSFV